uniref:ALOG domain-containing protein n=1 Tax=Rhabditophanes sp. KR3021 TaxID=114890 RepID=A0AC35THU6_9BILA
MAENSRKRDKETDLNLNADREKCAENKDVSVSVNPKQEHEEENLAVVAVKIALMSDTDIPVVKNSTKTGVNSILFNNFGLTLPIRAQFFGGVLPGRLQVTPSGTDKRDLWKQFIGSLKDNGRELVQLWETLLKEITACNGFVKYLTRIESGDNVIGIEGAYVPNCGYIFINPDITEAELKDPELVKKYILYVGESVDMIRRMSQHTYDYTKRFNVKEKAMHKVFPAGKEKVVWKKTYGSEDHALNIEDILTDHCHKTTNSDSGKPTYDIVKQMFLEKNNQVARLILQEFLDVKLPVELRKPLDEEKRAGSRKSFKSR